MDPSMIAGIVAGISSLGTLAARLIDPGPDPMQVLADMRAELSKMQASLGPGGEVERALASHLKAVDDAIEAEKRRQAAPQPTVLIDRLASMPDDEKTKP